MSVAAGAAEAPDGAETVLTVTSTPASGDVSPASSTTTSSDGDTGVIVTTTLASAPADAASSTASDASADPGTADESAAGTAADLLRLTFAAPGSTVTLAADGTGAIVSPAGDLVAGFTAPVVLDASGATLPASWQDLAADGDPASLTTDTTDTTDPADPAVVDLVTDPPAGAYPLTVTVHLGTSVVAGTEWGDREGGESLAVTPSAWGRVSGQTGSAFGWADLVRREPGADTVVMEKQFRCHQLGALDKATWNLEPWRPDVSTFDYLIARCNPT